MIKNKIGSSLTFEWNSLIKDLIGEEQLCVSKYQKYANEAKATFARPFIKYTPTWSRSFTPTDQKVRNQVAKMKQIPVPELIQGKKLLFVDDSIVRGTQLRETVDFLYESGAKEVHMRSACPPIMYGCKYLNFSRATDEMELIARRVIMELEGEEGGKLLIVLVTVIIVVVWLAILALLVKLDVGGFGSTVLHPMLKDVPYVNMILPEVKELVAELIKIPGMTSITINVNTKQTNVIMGQEMRSVWGQDYITDYIGNVKYQISPLSFFQVNPVQTRKLYERALEYAQVESGETVWDLYCGIGTISLFLAQKAKQVYGVEIVPQAIEDAKRNATLNGFTNAEFNVGKAEEVLPKKYREEGIKADVIVVDPPRKGCDEALLQTIVQMAPKRVVYVSCDSATLARDLKYLVSEGYEVKKGTVVDQFPHTVHTEAVVLLSKVDKK